MNYCYFNDLSNIKASPSEIIKDFNSRFNKPLNKIRDTSKPGVDVQNEWYISALPSYITIFVDRANKMTLVENMKDALVVEKRILALENKTTSDEIKAKKFLFKDELKKETPKDPFHLEGLQKVLKNMSNKIVDINKQVVESSSKKPFRPFRRNHTTNPQPPNTISNVENDDEDEDEATFSIDEFQDEQTVELNRMWDFILPISDSENEHEALPVSTRSKGQADPLQPIQK